MRRWLGKAWVIALATALIGAGALFVLVKLLDGQDRNSEAIRVSCVLLANTIVEAQAPSSQRSDDALAQLIGVLVSDLPPAKRREALRLAAQLGSGGTRLTVPDCERAAAHPESVHVIPLQGQ